MAANEPPYRRCSRTVSTVVDTFLSCHQSNRPCVKRHPRHSEKHRAKQDGACTPPSTLAVSVNQGRNPLFLSLKQFPHEDAARGRAQTKRKSKLDTDRPMVAATVADNAAGTTRAASSGSGVLALPMQAPLKKGKVDAIFATRDARRIGVSQTLASRHRDIQNMTGGSARDHFLQRSEEANSGSGKGVAPSPIVRPISQQKRGRSSNELWVRRCSGKHIVANLKGTTKARHLFRFWCIPALTATADGSTEGKNVGRMVDTYGARSARRRRQALRRAVKERLAVRPKAENPFSGGTLSQRATVAMAMRDVNASFWSVVRCVIQTRAQYLTRVEESAVKSSSATQAAVVSSPMFVDAQPSLSLARSFPLFGITVNVLWIRTGTKDTEEAVFVRQERLGIVLHETLAFLGVVLLPVAVALADPVRGYLDTGESLPLPPAELVRVPKRFQGASGSLSSLLRELQAEYRSYGDERLVDTLVATVSRNQLAGRHGVQVLGCLEGRYL